MGRSGTIRPRDAGLRAVPRPPRWDVTGLVWPRVADLGLIRSSCVLGGRRRPTVNESRIALAAVPTEWVGERFDAEFNAVMRDDEGDEGTGAGHGEGPLGRREPSTRVPNHREIDGAIVGRDADLVVRLEPSPSLPCGNDGNGSFSTKIRCAKQEAHLSDDLPESRTRIKCRTTVRRVFSMDASALSRSAAAVSHSFAA
jgi:hypothetical protein